MDIRKIKKLIELVEESGIAELEISEGEESVRISRNHTGAPAPIQYAAAPMAAPAAAPVAAAPVAAAQQKNQLQLHQQDTKFFRQWLVLSTVLQALMQNHS